MFATVETNQSCGTHVHVSRPQDSPGGSNMKCVARSILHFEAAMEVLVPAHRRGNEYARSNKVDNPNLAGKSENQCFQLIDKCTDRVYIADLMNANGDRYYAWKFRNLYYGGKSTNGPLNFAAAQEW